MSQDKSLLRRASEGFAVTFVGDSFHKVLGVATTFVVLAWLAPYDYGIWRLVLSAFSFMSLVALTGLSGLAVADMARELGQGNKTRADAVLWRAIQVLVGAGIVSTILLFIGAPLVSQVSGIGLTPYLWVLSTSLFLGSLMQVLQILFQARLEAVHALVLKNASSFAYLVGIILFLPYLGLGVFGLSIAYVLSTLVPVVIFFPRLLREFRAALRSPDKKSYRFRESIWQRGRWALAADYATILEGALWPWIVGYFLSIEEVGYAGLAFVIVSQIYSSVPLQYMLRAILPRFADDAMRMQEWIQRAMRYSVWIHAAAGIAIMGAAFLILPAFFPSYAIAVPLACALLAALPLRAIASVPTEWFYATGRQKELFLTTAIPRMIVLASMPFLLMAFGLAGFVIWYVLSSTSILAGRLWYIRRHIPLSLLPQHLLLPDATDFSLMHRARIRMLEQVSRRFHKA